VVNLIWTAVAKRSGDTAFALLMGSKKQWFLSRESGVALRFPPRSKK
jgi:hypothetical protein